MGNQNHSINYIELPLVDAGATKTFYGQVFGWAFTEWGPNYLSFAGAGVDGGFNGEDDARPTAPGVLVVLYATDLEATLQKVEDAGGRIVRPPFSFPGGRRFHFHDPNGNELAVWSE